MRYIGYFGCGCIVTDDYNDSEINAGIPFKNLHEDLMHIPGITYLTVYDENWHRIKRISR